MENVALRGAKLKNTDFMYGCVIYTGQGIESFKAHTYIAFVILNTSKLNSHVNYRVTIQLVANLPLTSKQKFHFGLARPGQSRPKRNFSFEVNRRFATS